MNKEERVKNLKEEIEEKLKEVTTLKELNDLKVEYLSKKGPISELSSLMKEIPNEEKKEFGSFLNDLKTLNNYNNFIEDEIENIEKQKVSFSLLLKKQGINEDLFVDDFKNYDEQINALKLKSENSISILNSPSAPPIDSSHQVLSS